MRSATFALLSASVLAHLVGAGRILANADRHTDVVQQPGSITRSTALNVVHQFPNETWVENIATRRDGKLLVTLINKAEVHLVDPIAGSEKLVYSFPNASSATGITELRDGLFAVAIGDWSPVTFKATPGSWSVWTIDYTSSNTTQNLALTPTVKKVVDLPEAYFLNGMTTLRTRDNTILIGDSGNGVIYRLNVATQKYATVIDSPALKPNASAVAVLGVNGIRYHEVEKKPYLYFTNSFKAPLFARFALNRDGTAKGPAQTIVAKPTFPTNAAGQADDFAFDRHGNAWITTDPSNTLVKVTLPQGSVAVAAGGTNSSVIAGDTSAAFGRTSADRDILYIVTNGGIAFPPPGGIVGGKVIAFDTKGI